MPLSDRREFLFALRSTALLMLGGCGGGGSSEDPGTAVAARPPARSVAVPPDHPALAYSHGFNPRPGADIATFTRPIADYWGREHVNPGARIGFVTDSRWVRLRLRYTAMMSRAKIYLGTGVVLVDGQVAIAFDHPSTDSGEEVVELAFASIQPRHVAVVLPINASVSFAGLELDALATLEPAPARARRRCVAIGDSNTQGYGPGRPDFNWPFLLAQSLDWDVRNAGYGGYVCYPFMAPTLADQDMDLAIYMIGINDYLRQVPLGEFRQKLQRWYALFRSVRPDTPLVLVSPTHCSIPRDRHIEHYREVFRRLMDVIGSDSNLQLIEGTGLTGDAGSLIRGDGAHFTPEGSRRVAANLEARLRV